MVKTIAIILHCLLLPGWLAAPCQALPTMVHAYISAAACQVKGAPQPLCDSSAMGDPGSPDQGRDATICEGSIDEDKDRDPGQGGSPEGAMGWGTHFWKPDNGPYDYMPVFNKDRENAWQRGQRLFDQAVSEYRDGDRRRAYYLLGRCAHLLEDMATPAHVNYDLHISRELFGDDSLEEYLARRFGGSDGWELFSDTFDAHSITPYDGGSVYQLFFPLAMTARQYDSDDEPGLKDRGARQGVSMIIPGGSHVSRVLLEWPQGRVSVLPAEQWGVSQRGAGRVLIILRSAIREMGPGEGRVVVEYRQGISEAFGVEEFTGTDMLDSSVDELACKLIPQAMGRVAGLYRFFAHEAGLDISTPWR